jgi:hypothetical protein
MLLTYHIYPVKTCLTTNRSNLTSHSDCKNPIFTFLDQWELLAAIEITQVLITTCPKNHWFSTGLQWTPPASVIRHRFIQSVQYKKHWPLSQLRVCISTFHQSGHHWDTHATGCPLWSTLIHKLTLCQSCLGKWQRPGKLRVGNDSP